MLLNKRALKVAEIASTETSRYALTGLLIDHGRVIASDGKMLVKAKFNTPDEADFPEIKGVHSGDDFKAILPAQEALELIGRIPKPKNGAMPILEHIKVHFSPTQGKKKQPNDRIDVGYTNLETVTHSQVRMVDGVFPNYDHIFPDHPGQNKGADGKEVPEDQRVTEKASIVVDPELLIKLLAQFRIHPKISAVKIRLFGKPGSVKCNATPMKLEVYYQDIGQVEGLLMPLPIDMELPKPEVPALAETSAEAPAKPDLENTAGKAGAGSGQVK